MDEKIGIGMKYFLGVLGACGVLGILAWGVWSFGNVPFFVGNQTRSTFLVQGVSRGSCLATIRSELFKRQGMVAMEANFEKRLLRIDHQPPLSEGDIVRTLSDLGYPAQSVSGRLAQTGGEAITKPCLGGYCDQNLCPATAASWRELFRKWFGNNF